MHCRNERGITLLIGTVSLVFIVPMIGLAIDVGFLYAVKSKLQASVDGAALAVARALTIGASTNSQATSAKNNAVTWFNANFPSNYFGTQNTSMSASNVTVADDGSNAHLQDVTVTATTQVDTFFMKWLGFGATTVGATGTASRRDVVVMLVLDRSYSIQLASACPSMISAAKVFTGQFAEGRDYIGLVTFSNDVWVESPPVTNFQALFGYTNDQGSGTGLIDNIVCNGNTNTAQAISVAYNELWKKNLPGALNVIMLETDGLPNTLTMNFWDASATPKAGISNSSTCTDTAGKKMSQSGFGSTAVLPANWTATVPLGTTSYLSGNPTATPSGITGVVGTSDPGDPFGELFLLLQYPHTGSMPPSGGSFYSVFASNSTAPGCNFDSNQYPTSAPADFAWYPATDVYGNQLNPTGAYLSVTMSGTHVANSGYTNFHNAAQNAADNAAYQVRNGFGLLSPNVGTTLQAYIYAVGLGGTVGTPPDYILMQRMTNDASGDNYNSPALYSACSAEATCVHYSSQPQGSFIFSSTPSVWAQAFLQISSQILRLSH
jgi:Flp pilus assembly protein TadG